MPLSRRISCPNFKTCNVYKNQERCHTLNYLNKNIPDILYQKISIEHTFVIAVNRNPVKGGKPVFSVLNGPGCEMYYENIANRYRNKNHGRRPADFIDKRTGIEQVIQYLDRAQTPQIHKNRFQILKELMPKLSNNIDEFVKVFHNIETHSKILTEDEIFHVEEYLLKNV
jgi:hypothetical protein